MHIKKLIIASKYGQKINFKLNNLNIFAAMFELRSQSQKTLKIKLISWLKFKINYTAYMLNGSKLVQVSIIKSYLNSTFLLYWDCDKNSY